MTEYGYKTSLYAYKSVRCQNPDGQDLSSESHAVRSGRNVPNFVGKLLYQFQC
jgi:hypothetical protein